MRSFQILWCLSCWVIVPFNFDFFTFSGGRTLASMKKKMSQSRWFLKNMQNRRYSRCSAAHRTALSGGILLSSLHWWIVCLAIISVVRDHMSTPHSSHTQTPEHHTHTYTRMHKFALPSLQPRYVLFHLRPHIHNTKRTHIRLSFYPSSTTEVTSSSSPLLLFTPTHSRAGRKALHPHPRPSSPRGFASAL